MSDGLAHGVDTIGTFTPIQLWAGEPNGQTTQGVAKAGFKFGQLNERGETFKFPVVALVDGYLIPYDPFGEGADAGFASATVTYSTLPPVAGDKITIAGVDINYVAAINPADPEFQIVLPASLALTASATRDLINANRMAFGPNEVLATAAGAVLTVKSPGADGNAVTLTKTFATAGNATVSASPLSGGTDDAAAIGGARKGYGILPHALDTTVTGYNADVETPVFISGHPNFDALDLPAGTSYREAKAAFAGTMINPQRLG